MARQMTQAKLSLIAFRTDRPGVPFANLAALDNECARLQEPVSLADQARDCRSCRCHEWAHCPARRGAPVPVALVFEAASPAGRWFPVAVNHRAGWSLGMVLTAPRTRRSTSTEVLLRTRALVFPHFQSHCFHQPLPATVSTRNAASFANRRHESPLALQRHPPVRSLLPTSGSSPRSSLSSAARRTRSSISLKACSRLV